MTGRRPAPRRVAATLLGLAALAAPGAGPAAAQEALPLDDAIRTALLQNPAISRAEANSATAAANRWADWGAVLPSASLSASIDRSEFTTVTFLNPDGTTGFYEDPISGVNRSNRGGLNFGLDLSAESFVDIGTGADERAAAGYRLSAAQVDVVRAVKVAYFDALKAQRLVDVAERQLASREEELELTRAKYEIAAVPRSDLLGAEIQVAEAELNLLDVEDALKAAVRAIRVAQGVDEMERTDVALVDLTDIPDAEALDATALFERARLANPDLKALAADERAAASTVTSARLSYLPTINLSFGLGRSRQLGEGEGRFTFDPSNSSEGFTMSASLPLFNGFQRKTRNAQASNSLTVARAALTEQELQLESDIRRLVDDIQRQDRRLDVLIRNAELAQERLELTREQYRIGSADYTTLQQSIEQVDQAERQAFEVRYDLLKSWAELESRVGDAAE